MGLIDFIKSAGEKILNRDDDAAEAAAAAAAEAAAEKAAEAKKEETLGKYLGRMGLEIDNLGIAVDDDLVTCPETLRARRFAKRSCSLWATPPGPRGSTTGSWSRPRSRRPSSTPW